MNRFGGKREGGAEVSREFSFSAPWGTLLKVISFLVTVLLLGLFGWMVLSGRATTPLQVFLYMFIPFAIISGCLLFMIRGFTVTEDGILVRRLLWSTHVDLGILKRVEHDPRAMTGAIRTWGNGGFYSFSGRFRSSRLGSFRAFVTDYGNCVVIETASRTIVVSPENPLHFVEILRQRIRSGR